MYCGVSDHGLLHDEEVCMGTSQDDGVSELKAARRDMLIMSWRLVARLHHILAFVRFGTQTRLSSAAPGF